MELPLTKGQVASSSCSGARPELAEKYVKSLKLMLPRICFLKLLLMAHFAISKQH